jgi:1-acyl-sn-glycerol-3-phosphate acyltransferase
MRGAVLFLIRVFFKLFNSIEVKGLENIPKTGPVIIAANHISNVDPPAIIPFVYKIRPVSVMAKKELFKIKIIGSFFSYFGAIPVDRKAAGGDISAIKKSVEVLKKGGCLLIFPEGTRSKNKNIEPKAGIAYLAHKTSAQIVPVKIFNSENFLKLGKILIMVGKPIDSNFIKTKDDYLPFSQKVMENIFNLDLKYS